jgi:DNA-binding ferritin-like protein
MNFIKRLFRKKEEKIDELQERRNQLDGFYKEFAKANFALEKLKEEIKPDNLKKEIVDEIMKQYQYSSWQEISKKL